jgi:hypothetical protein
MKLRKKTFIDTYIYIVLGLTMYTSGFIYNFVFYDYNVIVKLILIAVTSVCIPFITGTDYYKIFMFVMLEIFIGIWVILGGGVLNIYAKIIIRIAFIYIFLVYSNRYQINLLEYLCNLIIVCAAVYLIAWLLFDIGPLSSYGQELHVSLEITEGQKRSWDYTSYFGVYYRWQNMRRIFGIYTMASNGPFWEPGLYQIYLNLALWHELFVKKKFGWVAILLTVSIIVTTSTMGAITLVIIWTGYLYNRQPLSYKMISSFPLFIILLTILSKLWIEKKTYASGNISSRGNDLEELIQTFIKHPIFGNGVGNMQGMSALFTYVVDFGVLGIIFIVFMIALIMRRKDTVTSKIVLAAWLILSLMNEPIGYHSLFVLIIFLFGKKENLKIEGYNGIYKELG